MRQIRFFPFVALPVRLQVWRIWGPLAGDLQIGIHVEKMFMSALSGNVIDVRPVGALTSKPYALTSCPWETRYVHSVVYTVQVGSWNRVQVVVYRLSPRWRSSRTCVFLLPFLSRVNILVLLGYLNWNMLNTPAILQSKLDALNLTQIINEPTRFDLRSNYLLNSCIAGIEEADWLLLVGTNPHYEAPLFNARIRKRYSWEVALVGQEVDLTYTYDYLGESAKVLQDIVSGTHPFSKWSRRMLEGSQCASQLICTTVPDLTFRLMVNF
uniref:Uncharacterized protein n=1 Tax=Oncorhynchus tshawytscha TaxID=74940 RepID=A0A8C8JN14_ONCTS